MARKNQPVIVTVMRSGGVYSPEHVRWLHRQFPRHYSSACLTDVAVAGVDCFELEYGWPKWWSKLELFNPKGPLGRRRLFFIDLDSVIVGDIRDLLAVRPYTMLTDFYRETQNDPPAASAVMSIPVEVKAPIWHQFMLDPERHMRECTAPHRHGDQGFIGTTGIGAQRWQEVMPGTVVSFKKDVAQKGRYSRAVGTGRVPESARIVCFHGSPRPWESGESWVPPMVT